jgi:rhodanese-related sulfurtransferase
MKRVIFLIVAVTLIAAAPLAAQHVVEEGITFLDTQDLHRIYGKGDFLLVNTLSPIEFQEKRIAGSINIPLSHYADGRVSLLEDKQTRLVFYCMGEK